MMKRDQGLARNWRGGMDDVEPHFDDERTILSAQPVIPLETVQRVKNRRLWMFVGAFVVAALLGSAAALALIKIRQPAAVEVAAEPEPAEQPVAQVPTETETSEPTVPEPTPSIEVAAETQGEEVPVSEPTRRVRSANRRTSSPAPVRVTIKTTRVDVDEDQPRLIDQWQERRQRRVNRLRNPQDEHHASDLFRIREIFEGPRRQRRTRN